MMYDVEIFARQELSYHTVSWGAFGKFDGKTFIFSKVESDPRIQLSKSGTFRENSLGFDLPNGLEIFGGTRNRTTDNLKKGGTNSRTTDTPPKYR